MVVTPKSPIIGQTVEAAGLAHMHDLKLNRIDRNGVPLQIYDLANRVINVYDELYVSGDLSLVDELATQLNLQIATDEYEHNMFSEAERSSPHPQPR